MEVIKDILINLAANAAWAIGSIVFIYFKRLKKSACFFIRSKQTLKKIQGFDSPQLYPRGVHFFAGLLLKKSFLFAITEQSLKKNLYNPLE